MEFALRALIKDQNTVAKTLHEEDLKIQNDMDDPIAFKASTDPDTMYFHQAMKAPDRKQFLEAIASKGS